MAVESVAARSDSRSLVVKTLLITPSGALSPGPLSASAVALGAKMGVVAGILVAVGHTLFEAPYVAALMQSYRRMASFLERYGKVINAVVIAFLAWFAYMLLHDGILALLGVSTPSLEAHTAAAGLLDALVAGIVLTGGNAYFLLWWVTVGLPLIRDAASLGPRGYAVMYASHVWMDYAWLGLLAAGGSLARLMGATVYGAVLAALGAILLLFAADIAARSYAGRRILPL